MAWVPETLAIFCAPGKSGKSDWNATYNALADAKFAVILWACLAESLALAWVSSDVTVSELLVDRQMTDIWYVSALRIINRSSFAFG